MDLAKCCARIRNSFYSAKKMFCSLFLHVANLCVSFYQRIFMYKELTAAAFVFYLICLLPRKAGSCKENDNRDEIYEPFMGPKQRIFMDKELTVAPFVITTSVFCCRKPEAIRKTTPEPLAER